MGENVGVERTTKRERISYEVPCWAIRIYKHAGIGFRLDVVHRVGAYAHAEPITATASHRLLIDSLLSNVVLRACRSSLRYIVRSVRWRSWRRMENMKSGGSGLTGHMRRPHIWGRSDSCLDDLLCASDFLRSDPLDHPLSLPKPAAALKRAFINGILIRPTIGPISADDDWPRGITPGDIRTGNLDLSNVGMTKGWAARQEVG